MFTKALATALITAVLATGASHSAYAGGGGEGGFKNQERGPRLSQREVNRTQLTRNRPSISYRTRDGRTVEYTKNTRGERIRIERGRGGTRIERLRNRSRSWAHNHTTGVTSVGLRPGLRLVIGPFGIGISGN